MKALVTGGTGFVGSNLALTLKDKGYDVTITGTETEQKLPGIKCLHPGFTGIDWKSLGPIDVLFHQAAINDTTSRDKEELIHANYTNSIKLFSWAIKNGCKQIVYASSTAIYGDAPAPYKENGPTNPLIPYGESKLMLDDYVKKNYINAPDSEIKIVGLRYCNIYGPRENHKGTRASLVYQFAQKMLTDRPEIFKWGEQKRDRIYVKDVVEANLLASQSPESCIVNCGYGKATSANELVQKLNQVLGTNHQPKYIDNPYSGNYQMFTQCDMTLAEEKLGFKPKYSLEKGLQDYFDSGFLTKRR